MFCSRIALYDLLLQSICRVSDFPTAPETAVRVSPERRMCLPSCLLSQRRPEERSFERKALGLACLHSFVHSFERILHRRSERWKRFASEWLRRERSDWRGNNFVDKADAIGFLSVDDFAGENELQRTPFSDQTWKTLRASAARHDSQFHFGLPELCGFGSDPDRAGHGEFTASAKGKAIHRGDHRLAEIFDKVQVLPVRS